MLHLFLPASDMLVQKRDTLYEARCSKGSDADKKTTKKRPLRRFLDEEDDLDSWFHMEGKCISRSSDASGPLSPEKASQIPLETNLPLHFLRIMDGHVFLDVEPWYKTADFSLVDISSLDVILISSPESMLGLPLLTRSGNFTGKIYATSVTAKLGQLIMEELVCMHAEYIQNFGSSSPEFKPSWLNPPAFQDYPASFKKALVDDDGVGRANWHLLYRKKDIQACMDQIRCVHYDEEISIYDCLCIKASSSGFELGASNWVISGARCLSYFSASDLTSGHSMALNVASHIKSEVFLFSDLKSNNTDGYDEDLTSCSVKGICENKDKDYPVETKSLSGRCCGGVVHDLLEVSKVVLETILFRGSVLVLVNGIGELMETLEVISQALDNSNLSDVPLFFVSPVAEEILVYTNTIPEWLSAERQEKLYAGEALFRHVELLQQGRLHQLSALCSQETVKVWREPCVVFALNWGLRMGPAIPLMLKWRQDPRCLLVMPETGMTRLALAPFQPVQMKVLHYCRRKLGEMEVSAIIEKMKPELFLVPETMKGEFPSLGDSDSRASRNDIVFYNMWDILTIPAPRYTEADMMAEVACTVHPRQLDSGHSVGKVKVRIQQRGGKWLLDLPKLSQESDDALTEKETICWGTVEVTKLMDILQGNGLCCELHSEGHRNNSEHRIVVTTPSPATVELGLQYTIIETNDLVLRKLITDAVRSLLTFI
ncbi:hypothetical protein KP509_05G084800 [Ceratopteris richardii]|nr:hypothetical protein KP509_05G084800 [Ceratopteris richardii]